MADNPFARYTQPGTRGVILSDPYRAAEEERKQQDQANETERLRLDREAAERQTRQQGNTDAAAHRSELEWNATHFPDGTPKPQAAASAESAPDRIPQIITVLDNIKHIREMSDDTLAVGTWSKKAGDVPLIGPWLGQNRADIEGALQMVQGDLIQQQIALLSKMNGGKGVASIANSETEAARMAASIANLSPDQSLEEFQKGVDRAEQYYLRQLARSEGADTGNPETRKFYGLTEPGARAATVIPRLVAGSPGGELPNALTMNRLEGGPQNAGAADFGAKTGAVAIPPEMQAEFQAGLPSVMNGGLVDPEAYARWRSALDRKYFPNGGDSYQSSLDWAKAANERLKQGGATINTTIPAPEQELSGVEQFRNNFVNTDAGAFLASMGNAGGLGIPSLLASDQMDALRDAHPWSTGTGELMGSITGTMGTGAILEGAASKVASPAIARLLANPVTADVAYGAGYGATQGDDPLTGAVIGGGMALGGDLLGGQLGRSFATRSADDLLGPGERKVYNAVGDVDPVIAQLSQADTLGVPASIADVSPAVNSLTGAALRRSPEAAGSARTALADRSRGQYDRLLGAVERDLGPVGSIPQRSEDLVDQARAAASPLYDAAYAAPGVSSVDISDLSGSPSFSAALKNARDLVGDELGDPTALGFDLNDAGEVVLNRVPSWQTLDYVKRGLGDVIESNKMIDGRLNERGRAAFKLQQTLLSRMDTVNPDYAAARAAYAGPMQERAALEAGQESLRTSPDQFALDWSKATPTKQGQMRLGIQSQIAENAGKVRYNTNPFESVLGNPAMEQRLGTAYPEDDVARLLAQRDLERQLAGSTNQLVGNSMTAERGLADQAFGQSNLAGDIASGTIETLLTGAPVVTAARSGAGRSIANAFRDYRQLGLGARATALADDIAPIALDMSPASAMQRMTAMQEKDALYRAVVEEMANEAQRRGQHVGAGLAAGTSAMVLR